MAVRPGEENVAALFGDVHYFYGPETANPPHHRFDKGSYVYLFENASERRARIEIANSVGTDDEDAFDGSLDLVHVTYSYRHHCMVSLSVGDVEGHEEWHLPTYDPRNENKYHYRLHSLDIYFWTQDDALAFVSGVRRVLPPNQVDLQHEPAPPRQPHQQQQQQPEVSPVVQRLENVAISGSPSLPLPFTLPPPPPPPQTNANISSSSFAPPPVPTGPEADHSPSSASPSLASFAPIPYNPAAPAAPEQVRHRDKTPPPDDDDDGGAGAGAGPHPLHQRLAIDAATPFSPGLLATGAPAHGLGPLSPGLLVLPPPPPPPPQLLLLAQPPGAPRFPGAPVLPVPTPGFDGLGFDGVGAAAQAPHHLHHPPPPPALQRAATMPVGVGVGGGGGGVYAVAPSTALQGPYGAFPAPAPLASPGLVSPLPTGGYARFNNYTAQQGGGHAAAAAGEYAVHQQAYRPADGEAAAKVGPKKEVRGRLEENAGRVERGVTGMLKKFERKFG